MIKRIQLFLITTFAFAFAGAASANDPTGIQGLIAGFDFSSAEDAMYAGGAAVLGITVVVLGIQKVLSMLRGAGR